MKTKVEMKPISDRKVAVYKKDIEKRGARVLKKANSLKKLTNRDLFMILQGMLSSHTDRRVTPYDAIPAETIVGLQKRLQLFVTARFNCTKKVEVGWFDDKVARYELNARFKK